METTEKQTLKAQVITKFEELRANAIADGKDYIRRNDLGFPMYANSFPTEAARLLKEYILANNWYWVAARAHLPAYQEHGNTGIITWPTNN